MPTSDPEMVEFLDGVIGVVECDVNTQHLLWEKYHDRMGFPWEENLHGHGRLVGEIAEMPVMISLLTAKVKGYKLLFTFPTSMVADHRLIDTWLKENLPKTAFRKDGYINRTDAGNFCNIFPREKVGA